MTFETLMMLERQLEDYVDLIARRLALRTTAHFELTESETWMVRYFRTRLHEARREYELTRNPQLR